MLDAGDSRLGYKASSFQEVPSSQLLPHSPKSAPSSTRNFSNVNSDPDNDAPGIVRNLQEKLLEYNKDSQESIESGKAGASVEAEVISRKLGQSIKYAVFIKFIDHQVSLLNIELEQQKAKEFREICQYLLKAMKEFQRKQDILEYSVFAHNLHISSETSSMALPQ